MTKPRGRIGDRTDKTELESMTVEDHLLQIQGRERDKPLPTVREDEATVDDYVKAKKTPPEVRIISLAEIAELEKDADPEDTDAEVESDTDTTTDSETEQA